MALRVRAPAASRDRWVHPALTRRLCARAIAALARQDADRRGPSGRGLSHAGDLGCCDGWRRHRNFGAGANRLRHTRLSGAILFALRSDLYRHLQTLSPAFYGGQRMGDLLSRRDGDVAEIQRFAVDSPLVALCSVIGLVGAVVLMATLSWKLSLLVLVLVPIEVVWLRWMRRKVEARTRTVRERSADLSSFLVETLPAMKFIQASNQEAKERGRLDAVGSRYLDELLLLQRTEFLTHAVPATLTSLTRATAFLVGGGWVIGGEWQLGALIAFSTYLGMATGPVNSLLGLYVAVRGGRAAAASEPQARVGDERGGGAARPARRRALACGRAGGLDATQGLDRLSRCLAVLG